MADVTKDQGVRITGLDVEMGALCVFFIKCVIASIPAGVLLLALTWLFNVMVQGYLLSLH